MTYLEIVDMGAKLLALFHAGMIKFDCNTCTHQESLNCSMEVNEDKPVFTNSETGDLYTCPIRMIPEWISDYYDEYLYNTTYNISVPYDEKCYLQWQFERSYRDYLNRYQIKKSEKDSKGLDDNPTNKKNALNAFTQIAKEGKK